MLSKLHPQFATMFRLFVTGAVMAIAGDVAVPKLAQAVAVTRTDSLDTTSQLAYTPSAIDLINQGRPTFASQTNDGNYSPQFSAGPITKLNDGLLGGVNDNANSVIDALNTTFTTTFHLNTTLSALGYDITKIETYTAYVGDRVNQSYQVRYSTVDSNPLGNDVTGYTNLDGAPLDGATTKTINTTNSSGALRITLDITGLTGINAIQFIVDANAVGRTEAVYREFDVFGTAVPPVPEPSTLALLGLGLAPLIRRRRKRRCIVAQDCGDRC